MHFQIIKSIAEKTATEKEKDQRNNIISMLCPFGGIFYNND